MKAILCETEKLDEAADIIKKTCGSVELMGQFTVIQINSKKEKENYENYESHFM